MQYRNVTPVGLSERSCICCKLILGWPYTLKIDRATWNIVALMYRRNEIEKGSDMGTWTFLKFNKAPLPFLKFDRAT